MSVELAFGDAYLKRNTHTPPHMMAPGHPHHPTQPAEHSSWSTHRPKVEVSDESISMRSAHGEPEPAAPFQPLTVPDSHDSERVSQEKKLSDAACHRCHSERCRRPSPPRSSGDGNREPSAEQAPQDRRPQRKKRIFLLCIFYALGLGTTLIHFSYYMHLDGTVVGGSVVQQENIRVGMAMAVLTQFSFFTAAWLSYVQHLWHNVQKTPMSPEALDAAYGANESIVSLFNLELVSRFPLGALLAFLTWCLILPAFFTPATLYVVQGTEASVAQEAVPHLSIAQASEGHRYAYSPPAELTPKNDTRESNASQKPGVESEVPRVFAGPRTALSLTSTATAAMGEILPLPPPHPQASYEVSFSGPAVRCAPANETVSSLLDAYLASKIASSSVTSDTNPAFGLGGGAATAREIDNAYYAFVPVLDASGNIQPVAKPRERGPSNGTNEVWISLSRYSDRAADGNQTQGDRPTRRQKLVCELWNATYDISLEWRRGAQSINGVAHPVHRVLFPSAAETSQGGSSFAASSDMVRHAYSAFMWVVTDQVVGSLSWYQDEAFTAKDDDDGDEDDVGGDFANPIPYTNGNGMPPYLSDIPVQPTQGKPSHAFPGRDPNDIDQVEPRPGAEQRPKNPTPSAPQFGVIDTPLEHNVLLGCDDLDVFFDVSHRLYNFDESRMTGLQEQRQRDKALAGSLGLGELVEELGFNITVSLLQNELLTGTTTAQVTTIEDVNRYAYIRLNLFIPYALAHLFALTAVVSGCVSIARHGSTPGKSFSDVARATRDPEVAACFAEDGGKGLFLQAVGDEGGRLVFRRADQ